MAAASATEKPSMSTTHQRGSLLRWQQPQRGVHVQPGVRGARGIAVLRDQGLERLLVPGGQGGPGGAAAQPVQRRVHHDPVQPRGDGGLAAEVGGPAERGDHGVLECVGGLLGIAQRAQRHRPQPVPVPAEKLAERLGVPGHVPAEQLVVSRRSPVASGMPHQPGWPAAKPCTVTL